jgi:hypothetical protein
MQSSTVVLGVSPSRPVAEEARIAGLAWEQLDAPRPSLTLEIYSPSGREFVGYLGPHAPDLTPKEVDLLHGIWLDLSNEVAPVELHHHDVVHFSLDELKRLTQNGNGTRKESIQRLREHLQEIKVRREPHS